MSNVCWQLRDNIKNAKFSMEGHQKQIERFRERIRELESSQVSPRIRTITLQQIERNLEAATRSFQKSKQLLDQRIQECQNHQHECPDCILEDGLPS